MKYLIEVVLLFLVWLTGSHAIDQYHTLKSLQAELTLKAELNRLTTELALETLSAIDANINHFDKHAHKQLEFERVSRQLASQGLLGEQIGKDMEAFRVGVDTYMQLASMLKTSFKYVAKQSIDSPESSQTSQSILRTCAALIFNLQMTNSQPVVNAVQTQLRVQLAMLEQLERRLPDLRVARLHIEFIMDNATKASKLLKSIQKNSFSDVIQKNMQELNHSINSNYWKMIQYTLLTLVSTFLLVLVALLRLLVELKRANEVATKAAEKKSMFLSNMSHEIRTPMNGIVGLTDILLSTKLTAIQRNYLEKVRFSANALTTIINDILDFSKIESKKLHIEQVCFQFEELLDNLRSLITPIANTKGVKLVFDIDPQLQAQYLGDPVRIGQIMLNLASNAVKFTEQGKVTLSVKGIPDRTDLDSQWIEISVADTGVGIEQSKLQSLFERFTQAESSTTRKYGGTGLGLTICKMLTELMGGEISVVSEVGKGSVFTVRLPLKTDGDGIIERPVEFVGKLLIVEDDPVYTQISENIATSIGLIVTTTSTGQGAEQCLLNGDFDAMLLDWKLPDCEADTLLTRLDNASLLPERVIIYTAYSNNCLDSNLKFPVLNKPLLKQDLVDALMQSHCAIKNEKEQSAKGTDLQQQTCFKCRVLLVEDNEINQIVAKKMLTNMGAKVHVVVNGQQAVDTVMAGTDKFDIVLMDIQMPVMDGVTATQTIRKQFSSEQLPIIALTANVMGSEVEKYVAAGMNAHIGKPFKVDELKAILQDYVNVGDC
ncbi:hypothetical protein PA25_23600 [Pseudoalteromonas sp. A25]|uniref:response regulator n=1 Tax=Pseudoalteromonas sp. A25 TaxID=116092 RepID=UPI0012606036|nr:response regulator [Pseudoalteromonas sp. A25]BBN82375.1 hypothetical protein PA25_23600 [Pseudoalteromonas sp. A25]